jgi:transposase
MKPTAHIQEYSGETVLFVAFELSNSKWKLGMTTGKGMRIRNRSVDAGDLEGVADAVARAKKKSGLPEDARVVSCYEAGRDGFWIHRRLVEMGYESIVIDPASVDVNRRKKRRKTDRLDLGKLLKNLIRWWEGEEDVWSVVVVPSVEDEDARHFHRELETLKSARTSHSNRMKALLVLHGVRTTIGKDFGERIDELRSSDGRQLPPQLRSRLRRENERLSLVREQIGQLEVERRNALASVQDRRMDLVRKLMRLRSVGPNSSWLLVMEIFAWRRFGNRKEVGSLSGLTPTPFASGDLDHEQGIDKAGITRVRASLIELAWSWVRLQPHSELTKWFNRRFAGGNRRQRRRGIVGVARRLLIAFWHYLERDIPPPGAQLKKA